MTQTYEDKTTVTFWGTRGSISTPGNDTGTYGGNTPCVEVTDGADTLILDAGTGIRLLGKTLLAKAAPRSHTYHILLSHTHWDHIQGLPFFNPAYQSESRIIIYGSPRKERFLGRILSGQMDTSYFPIKMSDLAADIEIKELSETSLNIGKFKVDIEEQILHPGGSIRFGISHGTRRIVYATDVEIDAAFKPDAPSPQTQQLADTYLRFIDKADLLIADAQYTPEEYQAKKGWGHSCINTVIKVAAQANVKQLALFHHDPEHTDEFFQQLENQQSTASSSDMHIFLARDHQTIQI